MTGKINILIINCLRNRLDNSLFSGSTSIPDEKLRHLDPEGGYDDPQEVGIFVTFTFFTRIGIQSRTSCYDRAIKNQY